MVESTFLSLLKRLLKLTTKVDRKRYLIVFIRIKSKN